MAGRKERFLMEHILNLEQVKKYYGGNSGNITKAVDGISMYVDKGEFVAIMGASGSGKTTLLNCISTIDTVTSGHITVNNQDITKIKDKDFADFRRENLGFIFQDFNLLDTLTSDAGHRQRPYGRSPCRRARHRPSQDARQARHGWQRQGRRRCRSCRPAVHRSAERDS